MPDEPTKFYPGFWRSPDATLLGRAKKEGRYVVLTGSKDFNQPNCKAVYDAYVKDGFAHVTGLAANVVLDGPHLRGDEFTGSRNWRRRWS